MKGKIDMCKPRIYFNGGHVETFTNHELAFAVWLALRANVGAAFRGANDARPVYPWDYALGLRRRKP